jgi:hypothetical protein
MFYVPIGNREEASSSLRAVIGKSSFRLTGRQCLSDVAKVAIFGRLAAGGPSLAVRMIIG